MSVYPDLFCKCMDDLRKMPLPSYEHFKRAMEDMSDNKKDLKTNYMKISLQDKILISSMIRDNDRESLIELLEPIKLTFNETAIIKHSQRLPEVVESMINARKDSITL